MLQRLAGIWPKHAPELRALASGAFPRFVRQRRDDELEGVPVFCYHTVEAFEFDADLHYLAANGYATLSADQFLHYLDGAWQPPGRAVLLTFDDGPLNFFEVALPLLQRHAARAIAFVAPGMHPDELSAGQRASRRRPMSWRELELVHASGLVDLESHTLESRHLPSWPRPVPLAGVDAAIEAPLRSAPRSIEEDLRASRRLLESRLPGKTVRHLAFPMYDGTEAAVRIAVEVGFRACYWGLLPGGRLATPGEARWRVPRLIDVYLRSLPGRGRDSRGRLLVRRLGKAGSRPAAAAD